VEGRRTDFLVTPSGKLMHALSVIYVLREIPGLREFQVIQEALDRVRVRVVPATELSAAARADIVSRVGSLFEGGGADRGGDRGIGRERLREAPLRDLACGRRTRERPGRSGLMDTLGSSMHGVLLALAAFSALALAAGVALGHSRPITKWSFVLGMVGLAVESAAGFTLVTLTEQVSDRLFWLRFHEAAALGLLVPWGVFVASLFAPAAGRWTPGLLVTLGSGSLVIAAVATAVVTQPAFKLTDIAAPFYAAQLDQVGQLSTIVQILITVALLGGLDSYLRGSRHEDRWRMKYLVVGLGGIFLVRFFLLSQMLLFRVLLGVYLTTAGATLVLGNLAVSAALVRTRLLRSEVTVSRDLVYRSLVVVALGGYLLVVGALGWLLNRLGIPEELLWGSVLIFVSALAVGAVLLSENVRWRLKRFIAGISIAPSMTTGSSGCASPSVWAPSYLSSSLVRSW
jgi:hypothetical protein